MATNNRNSRYIQGNTVTKDQLLHDLGGRPSYETLKIIEGERRKEKRMTMSFAYVLFLAVAIAVMGYALISYLKLQSDITNLVDNISRYETTLNNLTLANDDEYSKMVNTVDYEAIKKIAIEQLGMVYASEDQIVSYTRENSDYVIQLSDIDY